VPRECGSNYNAPPNPNQTFEDDQRMEADTDSDPPRPPTWSVQINGLDETAIHLGGLISVVLGQDGTLLISTALLWSTRER
jgi:hypothetical protein